MLHKPLLTIVFVSSLNGAASENSGLIGRVVVVATAEYISSCVLITLNGRVERVEL